MEFREVVRRRRMVRRYADRPVAREVVERALAHAARAPSAGFTQAVEWLVLDDPEDLARFWSTTAGPDAGNDWLDGMRTAPVLLVATTSRAAYLDRYAEPDKGWTDRDEQRWPAPYWYVDSGMAVLLVLQTAVDEGLGACFFGLPTPRIQAVKDTFSIPAEREPVGVVALGHRLPARAGSAGSPARRGRRDPRDLAHWGRWS